MKKNIKTLVRQDMEIMRPFIVRDKGDVPPLLFFHFSGLDASVTAEMNTTMQNDVLAVESGFFVPMTREAMMQHNETFMDLMATVMASIVTMGIAKELKAVVISTTGLAATVDKITKKPDQQGEVHIASGISSDGKAYTMAQDLKASMGKSGVVYELVDSEFLAEMNGSEEPTMLSHDFFERYRYNLEQIPQDRKNVGILETAQVAYVDNPAQFVSDLIEAAIQATVLSELITQQNQRNQQN